MNIQSLKNEIALQISRFVPVEIKKGLSRGSKLYGNIFYNRREQEPFEEESFYSALELRGGVVIEAGAHLGVFTMYFAGQVGGGKVLAFEPNPQVFTFLVKNIRRNGLRNVVAVNAGLSDKPGYVRFVSWRYNTAKGTFKSDKQEMMKKRGIMFLEKDAPVTTIDQVVSDYHLERVDLVKIDTEGYEPLVIEGMEETLLRHRPLIYFEIHGLDGSQKEADLKRIYAFLSPRGYRIEKLAKCPVDMSEEDLGCRKGGGYVATYVKEAPSPDHPCKAGGIIGSQ
jgi:FkbM family methyltransferase